METFEQPKIAGYRQLSESDAALMNEIKAHGQQLDALVKKVQAHIGKPAEGVPQALNPQRWASMGATDLQTGLMALTRAVAQPTSF